MKRCYQVILNDRASEALGREAAKEALLPRELIQRIVRDWLARRENLRIHRGGR